MTLEELKDFDDLQSWIDKSNLRFTLDPHDEETIYKLLALLAERKWVSLAQKCPRCGSDHFCRNGAYHDVFHRNKCLECGKKFNDLTGTPFSWIHKPMKAIRFIIRFLKTDNSNVKIAKEIAISKNTVGKWKRKFC